MTDPYQVLGLARGASAAEVKRAYRGLAKKLHPDLNPGNAEVEQHFKNVSQAYDILGNAEKRKKFDRGEIDANGQATPWQGGFYRQQAAQGPGSKYRPFGASGEINIEDIISDLFSRRGRNRVGRKRGADVSYSASVGFLDAAIPLGAGTDAPFGDPDPWLAMQAAVDHRTRDGAALCPEESIDPERALALFTTTAAAPTAERCRRTNLPHRYRHDPCRAATGNPSRWRRTSSARASTVA